MTESTEHLVAGPELERISDQIWSLAAETGDESKASLERLSDLLRDQPADLVGVDLVQVYAPEVLLPDRPAARDELITRIVIGARDVLVFLPVALTWIFLSRAFSKPVPDGQTFLQAWGHDLTVTAVIVSVAITLVILVTAGLHAWEGYAERRASRASLRERLGRQLVAASIELAADCPPTPAGGPGGRHQATRSLPWPWPSATCSTNSPGPPND